MSHIEGGVGTDMAPDTVAGSSMRGVTGKESVQSGSRGSAGELVEGFGSMPVDSEHKACELRVWSFSFPHMLSFHCSWLGFFTTFVSTFAAAPMVPIIRNDLDMTIVDLGNGGVAAVTGTIFCRVVMGVFCDTFGPRLGYAVLMLGTAPAVFGMANVTTPLGFILCRFFIGFGLATFVACQFWSSVMFTPKIVGIANATSGGWGNLGGGVTQFLIPALYAACVKTAEPFLAWRQAFFLPGCMHIFIGVLVIFCAQDLPDGQYADLKKKGKMAQPNGLVSFQQGLANYRMWCLLVSYGMCFGVELTMNNVVTGYFFDQFDLPLTTAGLLGSLFGMMNLFARSLGGFVSDYSAKRYGMRGRLWALWILQTVEGALCVLMGFAKDSLALTLVFMVLFSVFVQASEGASYGVVPFVSKRSLGVVSGFVGAGGNAGSAITQVIFFKSGKYETYEGIQLMGVMIMCVTLVVNFIHFPMWGGMWFPADGTTTEEDYYTTAYTEEEKEAGMADAAYKFSSNARQTERPPSNANPTPDTPQV
jgi:NNP family nitrate/nitrite transporter-like MFS transporter